MEKPPFFRADMAGLGSIGLMRYNMSNYDNPQLGNSCLSEPSRVPRSHSYIV